MAEIFKEQYGVSLLEYINMVRISEAKRLFTQTDDKIVDIAYAVGFDSLSAFYHLWKNKMGIPTSAYRKENKGESLI